MEKNHANPKFAHSISSDAIKAKMESDSLIWGDKLILRGLSFHGFHGAKPEERTLGQKFLIDIDAWMDLRAAGKSDHLTDTVSYTEIPFERQQCYETSRNMLLCLKICPQNCSFFPL